MSSHQQMDRRVYGLSVKNAQRCHFIRIHVKDKMKENEKKKTNFIIGLMLV